MFFQHSKCSNNRLLKFPDRIFNGKIFVQHKTKKPGKYIFQSKKKLFIYFVVLKVLQEVLQKNYRTTGCLTVLSIKFLPQTKIKKLKLILKTKTSLIIEI